jgi:hypothetical protein
MAVDVELQSLNGDVNITVNAFTTDKVTGSMTAVDWRKYRQKWVHLRNVEFPRVEANSTVDMLIGLDYAVFMPSYIIPTRKSVVAPENQSHDCHRSVGPVSESHRRAAVHCKLTSLARTSFRMKQNSY